MEHTIRNIAKDLILQINEILNNDYLNAPLYDKANQSNKNYNMMLM